MDVHQSDRALVEKVSAAMQAGPDGQETMMSLFTADGVLVEPFSGEMKTHTGIAAIRARYTQMMADPRPPDFRLALDRVDTDGTEVIAQWTCSSVVMPEPMQGESRYVIEGDKIRRLEIQLKSPHPANA